jgi:hypothetical protein
MSQSDYINFKNTSFQLKTQKLAPVLSSTQYRSFINYNLENSIVNNKLTYNQLVQPNKNKQIVFGMEKIVTNCPNFISCKNTNNRPNRVSLLETQITPKPSRPLIFKRDILQTKMGKCKLCK